MPLAAAIELHYYFYANLPPAGPWAKRKPVPPWKLLKAIRDYLDAKSEVKEVG
jgi:hypothetical protein